MRYKLPILLAAGGIGFGLAIGIYAYYFIPATIAGTVEYPEILTDENIYGQSRDSWAQTFWKWNIGFNVDDPTQDPNTGLQKCVYSIDPDNKMIFLVDPYDLTYSAKCSIPSDKLILVPLLTSEWDNSIEKSITTEGMWKGAKEANEVFSSWEVVLDNKTLTRKVGSETVNVKLIDEILVRNSPPFVLQVPEHNKFDMEPGNYNAVVDGYYLILKPLMPGMHSLQYKIVHEQRIPGADLSYVSGNISYKLIVE